MLCPGGLLKVGATLCENLSGNTIPAASSSLQKQTKQRNECQKKMPVTVVTTFKEYGLQILQIWGFHSFLKIHPPKLTWQWKNKPSFQMYISPFKRMLRFHWHLRFVSLGFLLVQNRSERSEVSQHSSQGGATPKSKDKCAWIFEGRFQGEVWIYLLFPNLGEKIWEMLLFFVFGIQDLEWIVMGMNKLLIKLLLNLDPVKF